MTHALVLFALGSEELEAITVVNLLRRAGIRVTLAGLESGPLAGSRGTMLLPDTSLEEVKLHTFDLIVLPGGMPGTTHLRNDPRVISLVQQQAAAGRWVAAICAAPSVLAYAGLLDGRRATCFPSCLDDYPQVLRQTSAVEIDRPFITSRGPGTAIDFALTLIDELVGRAKRDEVERQLVR